MPATITHRFPRYIALPAVSAGIIGGAALGMAGMANASTYPPHDPTPRTGIVAKPETKAQRCGDPPAIQVFYQLHYIDGQISRDTKDVRLQLIRHVIGEDRGSAT